MIGGIAGRKDNPMTTEHTIELTLDGAVSGAEVISEWERKFEESVASAAKDILSGDFIHTVALTGPSCSGKTTTAGKLEGYLTDSGRRVVPVSIDDFYFDRDMLHDRRQVPDYESPSALDLETFERFTSDLFSGREAQLPVYNFKKCRREGFRTVISQENDVYIFEGIQALYPEIYRSFDPAATRRVFINVASSVKANGTVFLPDEIRLVRRLLRDYKFRSSNGEFTLRLWEGVRKNEEANIFPPSANAEITIDSTVPYDIYVMCPEVCEILRGVDLYSSEYPAAKYVLEKLETLAPYALDRSLVPADSVIREFIG